MLVCFLYVSTFIMCECVTYVRGDVYVLEYVMYVHDCVIYVFVHSYICVNVSLMSGVSFMCMSEFIMCMSASLMIMTTSLTYTNTITYVY